ncbi:MAG: matrixin family metalloprotease [Thermoanaerobaculia bacterium]|nr:matrixin family metalloprotease [Thermoanaerobaculia bacterium]
MSQATALVYAPISDADLLAGADRVVVGEVVEVRPVTAEGAPSLDYVVRVVDEFKSSSSAPTGFVTVRVPGGRRDDGLAMWIPGTPRLEVGERLLLFLADVASDQSAQPLARLYQHSLGLFHVVEVGDKTLAVRALAEAGVVFLAQTERHAAKGLSLSVEHHEDRPRDFEGFVHWLRNGVQAEYELDPESLGTAYADKFTLLTSRTGAEFGACGDNGGRPLRRFGFDEPNAPPTGWRVHFAAPHGAVAAFREALAAWSDDFATTVRYTFEGLTSANGVLRNSDGVNALRFDDPFDDIPGTFNGSGLLALGGPWFFCHHEQHRGEEFHEIVEGDIVVQDGVPEAFAATPWPERLMVQLLGHELGHTLGIGHSEEPQALMQAVLHLDPRGAALEPDDLAALEYLYAAEGVGATSNPPAPERPQAVTGRGPFVQLSWPKVVGASNYRIERRRAQSAWTLLTTIAASEFEDVYVDPHVTYDYRLRSQNAAGASGSSPYVRVTAAEDGRPASPSQLRAYPTNRTGMGLRWQSNSCEVDFLRLEVDAGNGFQALFTTIEGSRTELLLTGLRTDLEYGFRLTAENRWGDSAPSEPVLFKSKEANDLCFWRPREKHLCLDEQRFRVALEYRDNATMSWRSAVGRPEDGRRGYFSFFDPENLEVELSFDRDSSQAPILTWTSLTDQEWRVEIVDTQTDKSWTFAPPPRLCTGSLSLADAPAFEQPAPEMMGAVGDWWLAEVIDNDPAMKATSPQVPCGRAPTDLYLADGRFRARVNWWDDDGVRRQARALDLTNVAGGFEMTTNDELGWLVKLLDGRQMNGSFWLYAGPMRSSAAFEAELEITDLETGLTRIYRRARPAGTGPDSGLACAVGDVSAFGD